MSTLAAGRANAWWFEPRSGNASAGGTFEAKGSVQFTPPSEGDWVLVLDNASKLSAAPGQ
jgi:hypothetical protein